MLKADSIQFYGRTADDVLTMFCMSADLDALKERTILDCPGGPSSLTAVLAGKGIDVTACDPLYALPAEELRSRALEAQKLIRSLSSSEDTETWFDRKHEQQRESLELFLSDRDANPQRYLAASLPDLPFSNGEFDLVLSGHLLFIYSPISDGGLMKSGGFELDWHRAALAELCRVSRSEVRIYPAHTTGLIAQQHEYAKLLINSLPPGWKGEFTTPQYFQGMIGSTAGLRLWLNLPKAESTALKSIS